MYSVKLTTDKNVLCTYKRGSRDQTESPDSDPELLEGF